MRIGAMMCSHVACCLLLGTSLITFSGCSPGSRQGPPPDAPRASRTPDPAQQALETHVRVLDTYSQMPEIEQATTNDAMVTAVMGLVELAATYPPAHAQLATRSAALRQLIISAPQRAPIRKVEVYLEICARTTCEPDTLALLREVTARAPAATGLRNRLLRRHLRAMHAQRLYRDINANRDLLNADFDLSVEMTRYFVEQATLTAVASYEAALATGDAAGANQAADRALAFKASAQMLEKLIEAATRVGLPGEVERLKGLVQTDEPKLK